jgi:mRNA interferase MazF
MTEINRGELWLVDLNPVIGHEQSGIRPALIISDNNLNHSPAELVIIAPVTTRYRGLLAHVELESSYLKTKSYVKTEDIRSISTKRCIKKLGYVDLKIMVTVEDRVKFLLGFV